MQKADEANSLIELRVEKLVPGGEGMARHNGKVVFIPATLPGEKVRVRILKGKKDFAHAEVMEIIEASPLRQAPPCKVAGVCGGCDWQHIEHQEQIRQKVALTEDALRRTGGFSFPGLVMETGKPLGYRNRVQIHRDTLGRSGFLAKSSHDIVPISTCPVAHPALNTLFQSSPKTPSQTTVEGGQKSLASSRNRFPAWAHSMPAGSDNFLLSGEDGSVELGFSVEVQGRSIHFDLRCFFQSNLEMLEKLLPFALQGLTGKSAMDLYCGIGLFGAFLKDHFDTILAVEENPIALSYARRNIGGKHVFLQGKLENLILKGQRELVNFHSDVILVDPPRSGLDTAVRNFLIATRPEKLVYVSCNPVTLARDLKALLAAGFILEDLRLFDFYPQTSHIEAVAKLKIA